MASSLEFVEYAAGQLAGAGEITWKRMFGEYGLYCNGLFFAVICDNQLFVKMTEAGLQLAPDLPQAQPYNGAKNHFLLEDLEDREWLAEFAQASCRELAATARPKKPKAAKAAKAAKEPKVVKEKTAAFDYKKEYKEFYQPKRQPSLIEVPPMQFVAVRGQGDPNQEDGDYKQAVGWLYSVVYAIKMSKLGKRRIEGYFDFVAPPLEGLWWQEDGSDLDLTHKEQFQWLAMIRLPDFVSEADFAWALEQAAEKSVPAERLQLLQYAEGLCVQCLYVGPYDAEPASIALMQEFAAAQGLAPDFAAGRYHHEIYLSDPRRCKPENLKTIIRVPMKRI